VGMTNQDAVKWLDNLKQDIGQLRHENLWNYAQAIDEIIELLENLEDLEKKYTSLLKEKISGLIKENTKLNLEMNQAISERSIHAVDRR